MYSYSCHQKPRNPYSPIGHATIHVDDTYPEDNYMDLSLKHSWSRPEFLFRVFAYCQADLEVDEFTLFGKTASFKDVDVISCHEPPITLSCIRVKAQNARDVFLKIFGSPSSQVHEAQKTERALLDLICHAPQKNFNINQSGVDRRTALTRAIVHHNRRDASWLVHTLHADPNASDSMGYTPLTLAVTEGDKPLMRFILHELGADPYASDSDGRICSTAAVFCNNPLSLRFLKHDLHVDMKRSDGKKFSPLTLAVFLRHFRLILFLVEKLKVDLYASDGAGFSPATCATKHKDKKMILFLKKYLRLDFNRPDGNGHTPLTLAKEEHDEEMESFLPTLVSQH